jgi:L,D-transpeptidase catalytic domain
VKNLLITISMGLMCTSFTIIPVTKHTADNILPANAGIEKTIPFAKDASAALYEAIQLQQYGLSEEAFANAWKGYEKLANQNKLTRSNYLTICDFSQSSNQKRLYIIDVVNKKLITNTYVAHGKNSGGEFASNFSNTPESLQSSLGFYLTAQTYIAGHGLSLRLTGVDAGYNDKAFMRSIVIHGAGYVNAARAKAGIMMGRSFGCPAVPEKESAQIINTIKNGTCLFIYHPNRNYLLHSKILNG